MQFFLEFFQQFYFNFFLQIFLESFMQFFPHFFLRFPAKYFSRNFPCNFSYNFFYNFSQNFYSNFSAIIPGIFQDSPVETICCFFVILRILKLKPIAGFFINFLNPKIEAIFFHKFLFKNWKFAKKFILHENLKDEIGKTSPRQKHLGRAFFVYKKLGSL